MGLKCQHGLRRADNWAFRCVRDGPWFLVIGSGLEQTEVGNGSRNPSRPILYCYLICFTSISLLSQRLTSIVLLAPEAFNEFRSTHLATMALLHRHGVTQHRSPLVHTLLRFRSQLPSSPRRRLTLPAAETVLSIHLSLSSPTPAQASHHTAAGSDHPELRCRWIRTS